MGAGMMPKGGGGGGIFGFDPFGGGQKNVKPWKLDPRYGGGASMSNKQLADWNAANTSYEDIKAAQDKRQEAYLAMSQKTGPTPSAFNENRGGGPKQAGDLLTMGGAQAYEPALYGQPRKWRDQYRSIVNLRNP